MSETDHIPTVVSVIQNGSGLTVVEYRPEELLRHQSRIKLIVAKDLPIDPSIERNILRGLGKAEVTFGGSTYFLYPNRAIKVNDPPERGSPGSLAKYPIFDERSGIFFQLLEEYSSCNFHTAGDEGLYSLNGDVRVCRCLYNDEIYEGYVNLKNGCLSYMKPGECHKLEASNSAVNIGLMLPGVGRKDHHYPERCIKELLY